MSDPLERPRVESSLDDVEFLARSEHRVAVLDSLVERPRSRAALRASTGASASTIGRMLAEFEERCWVERVEHRYEATPLGAFVAEGMVTLLDRMETERGLREVWKWLPTEVLDLDIDLFVDAVVRVPAFGAPHRTVDRFVELVEGTKQFRGFTTTTVGTDVEALLRNATDGMETEIVWPPDLTSTVLESHPDLLSAAVESGTLTVLTSRELPCACGLFDDRIGLAGYDRETGVMRATVDTDAAPARRWAEALYGSYRHDARPVDLGAIVG
ncbi:helix-turn-helix transcriptional regulator [Halomarina oriensis]|uniref:MarR family transcriptional regulator n=1 Tax=Halomarina oriensis TaxID=671145 RepID=A0A6B0GGS5_9EURY|nr:MarR family transcriptional regulator [Halomarina oriensis]MWG33954.1 MarR family transcriptional regulator [Halomarina oriensis]